MSTCVYPTSLDLHICCSALRNFQHYKHLYDTNQLGLCAVVRRLYRKFYRLFNANFDGMLHNFSFDEAIMIYATHVDHTQCVIQLLKQHKCSIDTGTLNFAALNLHIDLLQYFLNNNIYELDQVAFIACLLLSNTDQSFNVQTKLYGFELCFQHVIQHHLSTMHSYFDVMVYMSCSFRRKLFIIKWISDVFVDLFDLDHPVWRRLVDVFQHVGNQHFWWMKQHSWRSVKFEDKIKNKIKQLNAYQQFTHHIICSYIDEFNVIDMIIKYF
jgi:hypothetical protein